MPLPAVKLFNPKGPDRVAVVWAEPAGPGAFLARVARGPKTGKLGKATAYGPFPDAELSLRLTEVADSLRPEGFLLGGMHAALDGLHDPSSARRGRAALRLGWFGDPAAVPALLAALPQAVDELCPIVDALGMIGDARAVPAVRPVAQRMKLSRRRSGVEALRNLNDEPGLAEARQRALEQLPPAAREALLSVDELHPTPQSVGKVVAAAQSAEAKLHGLTADLLYELATPLAIAAAQAMLAQMQFGQPFVWRYVKSVLKRATLRHDYHTFGWIVHQVERQGRTSHGTSAVVKSGYDGVERHTRIFGRKTRDYLRRAAWRYLAQIAKHRPERYAFAAAAAVIHYTPDDEQEPSKGYGALSDCYLLHRVLFSGGKRYKLNYGTMRWRLGKKQPAVPPPGVREEAFPALWDASPHAYLRLLGAAKLIDVQRFAYDAVTARHMDVLRAAPEGQILPMLDAPFEQTVELALAELERRFDATRPDWTLLMRLLADERPLARGLGQRWLRQQGVQWWIGDADRVVALLTQTEPTTRALVAELLIEALRGRPDIRRMLAPRLLAVLRTTPPPAEGETADTLDPLARVLREAMAEELAPLVSDDDLLAMIGSGTAAAQAVAGDLLGRRPEAVAQLGLERITAMAQHPLAAVRSAAHALLRSAAALWGRDPSVLLVLAESDWPDTRRAALDLLDHAVDFERLGFDGLVGLLDSNRTDVQDRGRKLAVRHMGAIDSAALVERLVQHPHPNVRLFALDLVTKHLPDGADALTKVEPLCRSALFDLWPQKLAKLRVVSLLRERGLRDAEQAKVAARILGSFARTQGLRDMEQVTEALVRIKLAYPQTDAPLALPAELVGVTTNGTAGAADAVAGGGA